MAFQTGVATDLEDLLSTLSTFLQANDYTEDEFNTTDGDAAWSRSAKNIYISHRWNVGTPQYLSIHQALGFIDTATLPGDHTDDSGNGYNTNSSHTNVNLGDERAVELDDGPFASYFFFEQDADPHYVHVVVQTSTGIYRHFGWGEIDKFGTWTGGEYAYGHAHFFAGAKQSGNSTLLDGLFTGTSQARRAATIHMEGLPGQGGSEKWGQIWDRTDIASPDDSGSNAKARVKGGYKGGLITRAFGNVGPAGSTSGFIPQYPISVWHRNGSDILLLGWMPDVRGMNMRNFAPEQEIVIGSDTWVVFPESQKSSSGNDRTENAGIAYKKVTA